MRSYNTNSKRASRMNQSILHINNTGNITFIKSYLYLQDNLADLVQDWGKSSALVMELLVFH